MEATRSVAIFASGSYEIMKGLAIIEQFALCKVVSSPDVGVAYTIDGASAKNNPAMATERRRREVVMI